MSWRLIASISLISLSGCASWGGFWARFSYSESANIFIVGRPITALAPTSSESDKISAFSVSPALPSGLTFDKQTGKISGTPLAAGSTSHTITAKSDADFTLTTASLTLNVYNFGSGKQGAVTISSPSTQINAYTHMTSNSVASGSSSMTIGSPTGFAAGDLVLIAQMQNASGVLASEYATISSIAANTFHFSAALKNSYSSNQFSVVAAQATQVVRVPEYTDFTITGSGSITAPTWLGQSGGLVVFRASGTVTINGAINVAGLGFRGGVGFFAGSAGQAFQGESYPGFGAASTAANGGGGGGGANSANNSNAGGGVAGYATMPANIAIIAFNNGFIGTPGTSGSALTNPTLSNLYLGSGGGGHGQGTSQCANNTSPGGNGGGIVVIDAYQIEITGGGIDASGNPNTVCAWQYQPSGPGSGGSVYMRSYIQHLGTNLVQVTGGFFRSDNNIGTVYAPYTASHGMIRTDYTNKDGSSLGTAKQTPVYSSTTSLKSPLDN